MIGNIFKNIPESLPEELFETILKNNNIHIERIVSYGHATAEEHWFDQIQNEWVIVLQGAAKIKLADGNVISLGAGDYLNLPAHTRHRVEWTEENSETIWLAVYY